MGNFDSAAWIKKYKQAIIEDKHDSAYKKEKADDNIKKKGQAVHSKDLLHTTKVDGKKADKVDVKIGAENDLAIEKDKDGMDVYAGGLREDITSNIRYQLGDTWSPDFDYVGMLKVGTKAQELYDANGLEALQKLYDSFEDVNYHRENKFLGYAIDEIENPGQDANQAQENIERDLADFARACMETLKDITKGKM